MTEEFSLYKLLATFGVCGAVVAVVVLFLKYMTVQRREDRLQSGEHTTFQTVSQTEVFHKITHLTASIEEMGDQVNTAQQRMVEQFMQISAESRRDAHHFIDSIMQLNRDLLAEIADLKVELAELKMTLGAKPTRRTNYSITLPTVEKPKEG